MAQQGMKATYNRERKTITVEIPIRETFTPSTSGKQLLVASGVDNELVIDGKAVRVQVNAGMSNPDYKG